MSAYFVAEIEIATRLGSIPTERRSLARSHRDHFPTRGGTTELLERPAPEPGRHPRVPRHRGGETLVCLLSIRLANSTGRAFIVKGAT